MEHGAESYTMEMVLITPEEFNINRICASAITGNVV
jgi:hypothetical protein